MAAHPPHEHHPNPEMMKTLNKIKTRTLAVRSAVLRRVTRRTWTPARVDAWLDDHLPSTGVVGVRWLNRRAEAWGIPADALAAGLDRARTWRWDGDGHHLTVIARRSSDDVRYRWRDPRWLVRHDPHALRYPESDGWENVEAEDVPKGTLEMVRELRVLRDAR